MLDVNLTLGFYTHIAIEHQAEALAALPDLSGKEKGRQRGIA